MMVGLGTDLCRVSRIERALRRWGKRFERRVFTPGEIGYCRERRRPEVHFASRFAAKEAVFKALGTGVARGVRWKEVEVVRQSGQAPQLRFSGRVARLLEERGVEAAHLSLTHDGDYALAVVVLEGERGKANALID